jgi:endonuclease/exonuclease/phosphatase (EEP) superfamily protein YafD
MTTSQPNFFLRLLGAFRNFYIAMTGAYGLSVVLFLLGRVMIGESWLVIQFFNTFAHLLWLPALILLPITLLMREWRIALLLLPAVFMLVIVYGRQFVPDNITVPEDATVIKILTHNIYGGNTDTEAILSIIRSTDADIVALQEANYPMTQAFERELSQEYPYQARHPQENLVQGMAFLSRYPIIEDEYWRFDWLPTPLAHQRIEIQLSQEQSIVVYNAHPTHPAMNGNFFNPSWRSRELAEVYARTQTETLPVIWLGDFNMPHLSDDYQLITQTFEDTYQRVGWGMGWTFPMFPQPIAFLRLDYVFISSEFEAVSSAVLPSSGGSDHLPLTATVALHGR